MSPFPSSLPSQPTHLGTAAVLENLPPFWKKTPFLQWKRLVFLGRSNVGKSSLLNALLGLSLARTSQQPGKTWEIQFYAHPKWGKIFVDLPGYGFAKKSRSGPQPWKELVPRYLQADPGLEGALLLLDARRELSDLDESALSLLADFKIPTVVVWTKQDACDTQAERNALRQRDEALFQRFQKNLPSFPLPPLLEKSQITSVQTQKGLVELTQLIRSWSHLLRSSSS